MAKKQKLELTWLDKDKENSIEPRILIEIPELSNSNYDAEFIDGTNKHNMIIHGDNLLALKALENNFNNKIKCIYIDPPYNTGNAFNKYDDNREHSIWLSLMRERLELLKTLLSKDGVIFVQINDDESAYLKVLMDEIFGRSNYETTFYVKVRHENRILRQDSRYQLVMEQVHCYRKSDEFIAPRRPKVNNANDNYQWDIKITGDYIEKIKIAGYDVEIFDSNNYEIIEREKGYGKFKKYQIRGSLITQKGSASEYYEFNLRKRRKQDGLGTLYKVNGMGVAGDGLGYRYIMQPTKENSKNGFYFQGRPIKIKENKGLPYPNFYDMTDVFNNTGYEGYGYFNGGKKPEQWIDFLFSLVDLKKGDIVLDSFLGSGTTAAVAMKKNLHFIGIELGEHAYTLCKPRLDQIINGEDQYGISYDKNSVKNYKFYELAPTLIKEDNFGQTIINPEYNAEMLAAAISKHEGYTFNPDSQIFWKQASNDSKSFLYVTTKHVKKDYLVSINSEMKEDEYLIIVCKSYDSNITSEFRNIEIKKIPQSLLDNCEFGVENYNLNIIHPPVYEEEDEIDD